MKSTTRIENISQLAGYCEEILKRFPGGAVIGLRGTLGAGKTTFVRAFVECVARQCHVSVPRVASPTYVFHQGYPHLKPSVDHLDLYRLEAAQENTLVELGYFEILEKRLASKGFVFIEWPEKVLDPSLLELTAELRVDLQKETRLFSMVSTPFED